MESLLARNLIDTFRWSIYLLSLAAFARSVIGQLKCDAEETVITGMADYNRTIKGCTEIKGNLAIIMNWENIEIPELRRIHGNLYIRDEVDKDNVPKLPLSRDERRVWLTGLASVGGSFELANIGATLRDGKSGPLPPGLRIGTFDKPITIGKDYNIHGSVISFLNWISVQKAEKLIYYDAELSLGAGGGGHFPHEVNELELYGNCLTYEIPKFRFQGITQMQKRVYMEGSTRVLGTGYSGFIFSRGIEMTSLLTVPDIYITEALSVEFPSLQNVNSSLELDQLQLKILEFPALSNIGTQRNGSLIINKSPNLFKTHFQSLETVQGQVKITGNQALKDIVGFDKLHSVSGDIILDGPIFSVSFPSLQNVNGSFSITSSASFNCTPWNEKQLQTRFVKGNYTCNGSVDSFYLPPDFERTSSNQQADPGKPSTLRSRIPVIAGASAGAAVGVLVISIGIFYFHRRLRKVPDLLPGIANPELEAKEAPLYEIDAQKNEIKAEAVGIIPSIEMYGDFEPVEMFVSDTIPAELYGSEPEPVRSLSPAHIRHSSQSMQGRDSDSSGTLFSRERDSWVRNDDIAFTSDTARVRRDGNSDIGVAS